MSRQISPQAVFVGLIGLLSQPSVAWWRRHKCLADLPRPRQGSIAFWGVLVGPPLAVSRPTGEARSLGTPQVTEELMWLAAAEAQSMPWTDALAA